ncbi:phage tail tape measure protein [Burkholderia vietnamiensis]|uniref:phage tail length tape measure family protein n=1 Tax=Burkholderia vietnamiensis TaxID=60552 RepID=UPI001594DCCB|nr:phage tail length tape measure family protein [Burkholderia vietnamiensis]MBR8228502.1 phage tail tape measure protein [Burkholderia vietnamiensis]MCA7947902.1 phage tail length tape measure family protein [Burkholderia vietnamiensis]HDR8974126.1 phage tail tape measure protein [Burkholderia vietnamiensis]HDR9221694.1 phage tail tape measure protein [Burkholderia vietnamiensis]
MSVSNNNTTVRYSVDASGVQAGVNQLRASNAQLNASQDEVRRKTEAVQRAMQEAVTNGYNLTAREAKKLVDGFDRLQATAGKTRLEMLNQQAAARGVTQAFAAQTAAIAEASKKTHELNLNSVGARREMMVLAHEAATGSWKNFAGSMMVMAEQVDAMKYATHPLALGLAAAGAAAYAFHKGISNATAQARAFHDAMNSTTGYAQQTRESIQGLAEDLSKRFGVGINAATDGLNQLVATGRVTADIFPQVGAVALAMSKSSGEAFDKTVELLLKQQDEVKRAAEEYQRTHHSMSDANMAFIESLEKTGQKHEAFKILIQQQLADIERETKTSTEHQAGFWDNVTAAWGRYTRALAAKSTDLDILNDLKSKQAAQLNGRTPGDYTDYGPLIAAQQKIVDANRESQEATAREAANKAALADSLRSVTAEYERTKSAQQRLSDAVKRDNEIIDTRISLLTKQGKMTDSVRAQLEAQRKQMIAFDTEHIKPTRKHGGGSAIAAMNAETQTGLAIRQLIEQQAEKQLQAQRQLGVIDAETYYRKLTDLQKSALNDQIALASRRADVLRSSSDKRAYTEAAAAVEKLQLQRKGLDSSLQDTLAGLAQRRDIDVNRYAMGLSQMNTQQEDAYQYQDTTRNMTARARAEFDARYALQQQYQQRVRQLVEQYALDPTSDMKQYAEKLRAEQAYLAERSAGMEQFFAREEARRNSFSAQMKDGLLSLGGDAMTNAELARTAFVSAWHDSQSALEQFITSGEGNFKKFTASILADLAKIALRQAEMFAIQSIGSSFGFFSEGGPVLHRAGGGPISGPGTSTSDSIPAMLSDGEFVVNAASTRKYRSLLESINSGHMAHFATGGIAATLAPSPVASGGSYPVSVQVNNHGGGGLSEQDAKDLQQYVQSWIDIRMEQRMREQGGFAYQMKYGQI